MSTSAESLVSTPRRRSYGWVMVAVAALAMVATLPGRTHGLGMITERLLTDPAFSLNRVEYSEFNLWATLLGGLFCLPCGWFIDRFGLKNVLAVVVALLGAVVLWMTHLTGNTQLFVAILLTRGFGQSALSVLSITMVGKWFQHGVTLPMAVYSLILSLGFAAAAQWAKPYGLTEWRVVWATMGWLLLGVMLPLALLLVRNPRPNAQNSPDDANATGDGTTCCGTNVTAGEPSGFMLSQAMATPAFWMFSLAICHMAVISSGLSLFNESVLNVQGFSTDAFYNLITLSGVAGLIAKLPVGWLGRQVSLARMQTVGLVLQAGCMLWLPHIHSASALTAYGIGMGVGGTISTVIFFSIWSQAFGARQLGRIQGFAQMLTVLASALGPRLLAECHAQTGDYRLAFEFLAIAGFLLGFGCWFVRVPRPEDAHSLNAATDDSSLLETVTP